MKNKKILLLVLAAVIALVVIISVIFLITDDEVKEDDSDDQNGIVDETSLHDPEILFELSPGVNLAGAEFGIDIADYDYNYPTSSLDYYAENGVKLVRLPFRWERIQPEVGGPLDQDEINQIGTFLDKAEELGVYVILDLHNYDRYRGNLVGSRVVGVSDLSNVWIQLVNSFSDHKAVVAYGIMNEPYDTNGTWHNTAQEVVNEIRGLDENTIILVSGDNWAKSVTWNKYNKDLNIQDETGRIVYEAHVYFDTDNSGQYECSFDGCDLSLDVGEENTKEFVAWLQETGNMGFIGEYGVPSDDNRWSRSIDQFLNYLEDNEISSTIWAGGPDWGDYILSIEPTMDEEGNYIHKPQMEVLMKYLDPK